MLRPQPAPPISILRMLSFIILVSDRCSVNMGKNASKELKTHDSSASYLNADEEVIEEVPTLHAGPIHSLCVVDEDHFASGGVDKVSSRWAWGVHAGERIHGCCLQ